MMKKALRILLSASLLLSCVGLGTAAWAAEGTSKPAYVSDLGQMVSLMDPSDGRLAYTNGAVNADGSAIAMPKGGMPMVTSSVYTQDVTIAFDAQFTAVERETDNGQWLMAMVLRDQMPSGKYHFDACGVPVRGYQLIFYKDKVSVSVAYGTGTGDPNLINNSAEYAAKLGTEGVTFDLNAFWAAKNSFEISVLTQTDGNDPSAIVASWVKVSVNGVLVLDAADSGTALARNPIARPGGWSLYSHGFAASNQVGATLTNLSASYKDMPARAYDRAGMTDMLSVPGKVTLQNGAQVSGAAVAFGNAGNPSMYVAEKRKDIVAEFDYAGSKQSGESGWIFILIARDPNPSLAPWAGERSGDQGYSLEANNGSIVVRRRSGAGGEAFTDLGQCDFILPGGGGDNTAFWERNHHFRFTLSTLQNDCARLIVEVDGARIIDFTDDVARNNFEGGVSLITEAKNYGVTISDFYLNEKAGGEEAQFDRVDDEELTVDGQQIDLIEGREKYFAEDKGVVWDSEKSLYRFPDAGVPVLYSTSKVADAEFRFTYRQTKGNQTDWQMMVFFRDQAPGLASWNRAEAGNGGEAYYLMFNPASITLNYVDKAGNASAASFTGHTADILSPSFWGQEHDVILRVKTLEDCVKVQLVMDGKLILSARDTKKAVVAEGGFSIVTQGRAAGDVSYSEVELTKFTANVPEKTGSGDEFTPVEDDLLAVDGEQVDMLAERVKYLMAFGAAFDDEKRLYAFPDAGTPIVYTSGGVTTEDCAYEFTYTQTSGNRKDWQMMVFFRDQAPGLASWNRETSSHATAASYFFQFDPKAITLKYVDKTGSREVGGAAGKAVIPSSTFWRRQHTVRVLAKTLEGGVKIQLVIDGVLVISATDTDSKIAEGGGFGLLTHGKAAGGADANFSTVELSALSGNVPKIADFTTDTRVDFTQLVADVKKIKGNAVDSASRSVVTHNGIKMEPGLIRGAYYDTYFYRDFNLEFKASISWKDSIAKDWGALLTFRDDTPHLMPWDNGHGNCYVLMWGYNTADGTTNLILWKYLTDPDSGAKSNVKLAAAESLRDDSVEHAYELICGDVENGVRIVLKKDGDVVMDTTDTSNPLKTAGMINTVSGSGCAADFIGMTDGPTAGGSLRGDVEIGNKQQGGSSHLAPQERPDYDMPDIPGLQPAISDPEIIPANTGLIAGLSAGGGALVLGGGILIFFLVKRKRA